MGSVGVGETGRAGCDAGLIAHYELDGSFSDISGRYQHGRTVDGDPTFDAGQVGRAASFDGDTEVSFGNVGAFDRGEPFSLAVWLKGRGNLPMSVFQKIDSPDRRRGYEWTLDDITLVGIQKWAARLTVASAGDAPARRSKFARASGSTRRLVSRRADLRRVRQGGRRRPLPERRAVGRRRRRRHTDAAPRRPTRRFASGSKALGQPLSGSSTICASTAAC